MEMRKTCAFTGMRPEKLPVLERPDTEEYKALRQRIRAEIVRLITEEGTERFLCGMARGADMLCAEIVLELKREHPGLRLECVIPYEEQAAYWSEEDRDRYFDIVSRCDREIMLQRGYTRGCLQRRNRYLADHADILLAVWNGADGGTEYMVKYAEKKNIPLVIVDPGVQA